MWQWMVEVGCEATCVRLVDFGVMVLAFDSSFVVFLFGAGWYEGMDFY